MKNIFTLFILSFLSLTLSGCDPNAPTHLQRRKEKVVDALTLKIKSLDESIGFSEDLKNVTINPYDPPEKSVAVYSNIYKKYVSIMKICNNSVEVELYSFYSRPRDRDSSIDCMDFIDNKLGYNVSPIAEVLDSALQQSSIEAFAKLYSYEEIDNKLTDRMVNLKSKYINNFINLTENNLNNSTLIYLKGVEEVKGKYVLKNLNSGIISLHKAWLLGSSQAPRAAATVYGNLKDYKNAYLWRIRCIKECINSSEPANLPVINKFSYSLYLDDLLGRKTIYEIQELATHKDIYQIDINN